jgi:hypothetical protein
VHQGDALVEPVNPELSAALVLAEAQADEARAARDRVYAGVRADEAKRPARRFDVRQSVCQLREKRAYRKD